MFNNKLIRKLLSLVENHSSAVSGFVATIFALIIVSITGTSYVPWYIGLFYFIAFRFLFEFLSEYLKKQNKRS